MDLSYDGIYNTLKEIVDEKGEDYVYTDDPKTLALRESRHAAEHDDCYYAGSKDGSEPGCIIGHLVHKLRPNLRDLNILDGYGAIGALRKAGFSMDYRTKEGQLLAMVQRKQDAGVPWGEALSTAKEFADKYKGV